MTHTKILLLLTMLATVLALPAAALPVEGIAQGGVGVQNVYLLPTS